MGKNKNNARAQLRNKVYFEYRKYMRDVCEECGDGKGYWAGDYFVRRSSILTVHHIDEDITNNKPENLQTLCRKCHTKKHLCVPDLTV